MKPLLNYLSKILVLVLLVTDACSADAQDILHIGHTAEPGTLDPHRYFSNAEEHILKDLFLGLTTMGPKGEILPGAAKGWTVSADGLQWRFQLHKSATWSDGQPLTAQDFVFGLRRHQDPKTASPLAHFLYCIKNAESVNRGTLTPDKLGVATEGKYTLLIELEQPFPFLLERLLYPIAYPIPSHTVAKHGDLWVKAENWVSNGAYTLKEWRPRQYVELRKNNRFLHAQDTAIDIVRYYPMTEPVTAYNRFIAGDLDIAHGYPHNMVDKVSQERPAEVKNSLLQSIMYLVFNTQLAPFNDTRVREALATAIYKERITDTVLGAGELPSATLSPPIVEGFSNNDVMDTPSTERAQDLLAKAGYSADRPLRVTLRYISNAESKRVFIAIAAMWQDAGIETTLHHANLPTHFNDLQQGDFQVAQAGWFGENNPEHYIELLWSKINSANYGRYASPEFDAIFEQAQTLADPTLRLARLAEAERIGLRDFAVIPLYVTMSLNLVKKHVGGWHTNRRNLHPARFLYWQQEPP